MKEHLQDVSLEDLSEEVIDGLVAALGTYMTCLSPLVQGFYELSKDLLADEVAVRGESNLLNYDELDRKEIVKFLEHKNEFVKILDDSFSGIKVVFGNESDSFIIGNSSFITSKYQKGKSAAGSLGVIGPMRIDYSKIIPYIEYFTRKITNQLTEEGED
jgi:heat-inducible transcriptional repressor